MKCGSDSGIWIAGLGNDLMSDDGVGVVAARMLAEDPPPDACVSEVGTAVMSYGDMIAKADKIIFVDAVASGKAPGSITVLGLEDMDCGRAWVSAHNLNFMDALRLFRAGGPPHVKVVGIEPGVIDYGLDLSEPVKAAIPAVIEAVRRTAAELSAVA